MSTEAPRSFDVSPLAVHELMWAAHAETHLFTPWRNEGLALKAPLLPALALPAWLVVSIHTGLGPPMCGGRPRGGRFARGPAKSFPLFAGQADGMAAGRGRFRSSSQVSPFGSEDSPDLLVVAPARIGPCFASHTLERHAEPLGHRRTAVVVGPAVPLGSMQSAHGERPVQQRAACLRDHAVALGGGLQPTADLARADGGVEAGEHHATDQHSILPDAVQPGTVARLEFRIPLECGARSGQVVGDERRTDPRADVLTRPVEVVGELLGVPDLQRTEVGVVAQRQREHEDLLIRITSVVGMYRGGMPRTRGDHEARRRDVSEAVWQVMAARGFAGLTLRAVATELGATTGLLTHYFPTKRALVEYALELLEQRTLSRPRRNSGRGLAALRDALLDILPMTPEATDGSRIWVSSWDAALADPGLSAGHARKYAVSRDRLTDRVAVAQELGELPPGDPADVAAGAQSFVLGLVVQALFAPTVFPPQRQVQLLDAYLGALTAPDHSSEGRSA